MWRIFFSHFSSSYEKSSLSQNFFTSHYPIGRKSLQTGETFCSPLYLLVQKNHFGLLFWNPFTYQVVTDLCFCTKLFVEKEKSSPSESRKGLLVIVYLFFSPFSPHSAKISAKSKNAKSPCKQYVFGFSALSTDEFAQTKKFHQVP